uniref:Uncharacterized protein n=1 Tax=Chenopodium quinoa TaxID=63459 RepID=A0A803LGG7_CHEQI
MDLFMKHEYLPEDLQAEQMDVFISDLARVHSGEVTLVQECGDLLSRTHLSQVKQIHQEKKLEIMADKDLMNEYDMIELDEIVQVALLCTQFLHNQRPKMSKVVRILVGDGLAEKWEDS